MNNWRLLLLAIVAVFQPIASFTDRNLIDGRQQCCDRLSSAPLQDTRSPFYGTYRLDKTISALRRLNERDEIREERRYELSPLDSIYHRPSTVRPLVDIRGRVARQGPTERSSGVEYRLRPAISQSRERLLDVHQKADTARTIRDLKTEGTDFTRRVVDRGSRDTLRRHDRVYADSSRDNSFRNEYRTERIGERLSNNLFESQREKQREQFKSVERRIPLNRDARLTLSRTKDDVLSIKSSNMNNRQRIARERLSVVRRESSIRPDASRYSEHNNERRNLYRNNEQRRSLSENTQLVDQVSVIRNRINARGENPASRQRLFTDMQERREQREDRRESTQPNNENINHRAYGDRMQVARSLTRDSRIMNNQNERDVVARREIRRNDRLSREPSDENRINQERRLFSERIQMDQRNIRDSENSNEQNVRDINVRAEMRHSERVSRTTRDETRDNLKLNLARERIQISRRNTRESRILYDQNKINIDDRREIRHNERMSRDTRKEIRDNMEQRLSRERTQAVRRDTRESRIINDQNKINIDDQREIRHSDRMSRDTRKEIRDNMEQSLSRERTQVDRRDTQESRNTKNVDDRRDSRNNERISRNIRDERENQVGRAQVGQRNIREFRVINHLIARDDDRRIDSSREKRYNHRMNMETSNENRLTYGHRLSLERIQMERRNSRDFRTVSTPNDKEEEIRLMEKSTEERKEVSLNPEQRISRERIQMNQRDIREFTNLAIRTKRDIESQRKVRTETRLSRERNQMDRQNSRQSRIVSNLRESRLNRIATRNDRSIDANSENRREIKYNERLLGQIRSDQSRERQVGSRSVDRVNNDERRSLMTDRRARSADRRNFREIRNEARLSRSADSERRSELIRRGVEHSRKIENRKRETIDGSRNIDMARNREMINSAMVRKMETENDLTVSNWQYVLYTLQAAYLCAIFMQMLTPSRTEKPQKMSLRWLPVSSYYNPIKVD